MPAPTPMYRPQLEPGVSSTINRSANADHSYYDVSILKPPVWRWQIATYFFLGGLSAGAYVLARLAERFGGKDRQFRQIAKIGTYTAALAAAPCPILLIWDLGDAARFHHMLRVFKPSSPMSLGTWVLTAITPIAYGAAARELLLDRGVLQRRPGLNAVAESFGVVADAAGIPLALLLGTYTGVLLTNTSNPIWCRNKWLTALFAVGSFSTGVSTIALVHKQRNPSAPSRASRTLRALDSIGHIAEAVAFEGYLHSLGPLAKPFKSGSQAPHTALARAGLVASEIIKRLPARRSLRRKLDTIGSVLGLASAFAIRWAVVHAGHESAKDPAAARQISRARDPRLYARFEESGRESLRSAEQTRRAPQADAISAMDTTLKENPRHR